MFLITWSAVNLIWCTREKLLLGNRRISCSRSRDALSLFSCAKMAAMTSREKSPSSDQDLLLQWHYKLCRSKLYFFVSWPAVGIGCFRDTGKRAISTLEGRSFLLTGSYRSRRYAIEKCAQAAYKRGYKLFAVQHGGWCAASRNGHRTYARYGKSNKCRNGKGGPWANDVYVLQGGFPVVNLTWQWTSRHCFHIFFVENIFFLKNQCQRFYVCSGRVFRCPSSRLGYPVGYVLYLPFP